MQKNTIAPHVCAKKFAKSGFGIIFSTKMCMIFFIPCFSHSLESFTNNPTIKDLRSKNEQFIVSFDCFNILLKKNLIQLLSNKAAIFLFEEEEKLTPLFKGVEITQKMMFFGAGNTPLNCFQNVP